MNEYPDQFVCHQTKQGTNIQGHQNKVLIGIDTSETSTSIGTWEWKLWTRKSQKILS